MIIMNDISDHPSEYETEYETNVERTRRIRDRNRVILIILLAVVGLFYAITLVRIGGW